MGEYDCILCGRNLGKSAESDLRGARVDYCSIYDHDIVDGTIKPIDHGISPFELVRAHERWLRNENRRASGRGCAALTDFGATAPSTPSSSCFYTDTTGGIRLLDVTV